MRGSVGLLCGYVTPRGRGEGETNAAVTLVWTSVSGRVENSDYVEVRSQTEDEFQTSQSKKSKAEAGFSEHNHKDFLGH